MAHWLVKSEPSAYSWTDLLADKKTNWDGVRNYQARNNLASMRKGDLVLVYHSVGDKEIVGIAKVVREAFPDPTADDPRWVAVGLAAVEPLARPVSLEEIKSDRDLCEIPLVRQSRLSVMPLAVDDFQAIVALAKRRKNGAATQKAAAPAARAPRAKRKKPTNKKAARKSSR